MTTKDWRYVFTRAVLNESPVPMIEPIFGQYEYDNGKSAFRIHDSFEGTFEVTIKQVS